jgi:intracellular septation protein A
LAVVNEIMRNTLTTAGWITWHFPVLFGLTLVFIAANLPFIMRHHVDDEAPNSSAARD